MDVDAIVRRRILEFKELGERKKVEFDFSPFLNLRLKATIMTELAFCISTANSSAHAGLRFQKLLEGINPLSLSIKELESLMRSTGVRFAGRKAEYIFEALRNFEIIESALEMNDRDARMFLARKVRGLGYKEASHFLRNVGREDVAIVDRHILRWLTGKGYILDVPKSLSAKSYERIEKILKKIAKDRGVSLAELDLRLWFEMTGKILK